MKSRRITVWIMTGLLMLALAFLAVAFGLDRYYRSRLQALSSGQESGEKAGSAERELREWRGLPQQLDAFFREALVDQAELPMLRNKIAAIFLKLNVQPPEFNFVNYPYAEGIRKSELELKFRAGYEQIKRVLFELEKMPKLLFSQQVELVKEEATVNATVKVAIFIQV